MTGARAGGGMAGEWEGFNSLAALRGVWGHAAFRDVQGAVVEHVRAGGSGLALLPTGGGKSLCYQIPAMVRPGLGLVVSPLLSLMEDQVSGLAARGVSAAALHSGMDEAGRAAAFGRAASGGLDLLYVSPERLGREDFRRFAAGAGLSLVAVDECHVVSSWGNDFRPAYREIPAFLRLVPRHVPRVAVTATADPLTVDDVRRLLGLGGDPVFRSPSERPNLTLSARRAGSLAELVREGMAWADARRGRSGIVYCRTRAETEAWQDRLATAGHPAVAYHAGMGAAERARAQAFFMDAPDALVVATVAFGMGIDKPATRWVLHIGLPASPEAYAQETGRAGRDGLPAEAMLLWREADIGRGRALIERARAARMESRGAGADLGDSSSWSMSGGDVRDDHARAARQRFEVMAAAARAARCRPRAVAAHLGERGLGDCGRCDACLSPPPVEDRTAEARAVFAALSEAAPHAVGAWNLASAAGRASPEGRAEGAGEAVRIGLHVVGQMTVCGWLHVPPGGAGRVAATDEGLAAAGDPGFRALLALPPPRRAAAPPPPAPKTDGRDWRAFLSGLCARHGLDLDSALPQGALADLPGRRVTSTEDLLDAGVPAALVGLHTSEWAAFLSAPGNGMAFGQGQGGGRAGNPAPAKPAFGKGPPPAGR